MPPSTSNILVLEPETVEQLETGVQAFLSTQSPDVIVPHIIHQVWLNPPGKRLPIPDKWKDGVKAWQDLHPGWLYILWRSELAEQFIQRFEGWFWKTYKSFPYLIQRADSLRYCFLKRYGGVYADLDLAPKYTLEEVIQSRADVYLVNSANSARYYTNMFMMSQAGSKFWDLVLQNAAKPPPWWALTKLPIVMETAGPSTLTRAVESYDGEICRLPRSKFNPSSALSIATGKAEEQASDAVMTNLEGFSWHGWDSQLLLFAGTHPYLSLFLILLLLLLIVWCWKRWRTATPQPQPSRPPLSLFEQ